MPFSINVKNDWTSVFRFVKIFYDFRHRKKRPWLKLPTIMSKQYGKFSKMTVKSAEVGYYTLKPFIVPVAS